MEADPVAGILRAEMGARVVPGTVVPPRAAASGNEST
jgi:hypothetical protein